MPMRRAWKPLERDILRGIPDRYGVYEFGDDEGAVIDIGHGPLRDVIKEALAYRDDVTQVRYEITPTKRAAEKKAAAHTRRLHDRA